MRRGIIAINNSDNLCLPRALVVAIAKAEKDSAFVKVREDKGKLQLKRALKLMEDASVTIPGKGAGIRKLQLFQRHLADKYEICVYQYRGKRRDVMFEGVSTGCTLNLIYHQRHYNLITSFTAAFCCSYYCGQCHTPYNTKNDHRCDGSGQACQQTPACVAELKIKCSDCGRWFKSQKCFQNHIKLNFLGKTAYAVKLNVALLA